MCSPCARIPCDAGVSVFARAVCGVPARPSDDAARAQAAAVGGRTAPRAPPLRWSPRHAHLGWCPRRDRWRRNARLASTARGKSPSKAGMLDIEKIMAKHGFQLVLPAAPQASASLPGAELAVRPPIERMGDRLLPSSPLNLTPEKLRRPANRQNLNESTGCWQGIL